MLKLLKNVKKKQKKKTYIPEFRFFSRSGNFNGKTVGDPISLPCDLF